MSAQNFQEIVFNWADGATASEVRDLSFGRVGMILVPSGSSLIAKTLQFAAVSQKETANFAQTNLLATPITLAAGANPISSTVAAEIAAVGNCRLVVNSAVTGASKLTLLWKS
jgi:hypothetical protein